LKLITAPGGKSAARPDVGDDVAMDVAFNEEADHTLHWFYELEDVAAKRHAAREGVEDAVGLLLKRV